MNIIELDGRELNSREEAYDYLYAAFDFPSWTGRNLDGFYDALTDIGQPVLVRIKDSDTVCGYGRKILDTISDASCENPNLTIETL